jgi:hypothetical protein
MSVAPGDQLDIWVGQGGATATAFPAGTPGIGSNLGAEASGGQGDDFNFDDVGGSGGGLTSVEQTGSAAMSFVVPAGAGGSATLEGQDVTAGQGGGALDSNGENASVGSGSGGGGAGEIGGSVDAAGTYGALATGLTSTDGFFGQPANTSAADYSLCQGLNGGAPGAGQGDVTYDVGGDGCVVLRCVAP